MSLTTFLEWKVPRVGLNKKIFSQVYLDLVKITFEAN